MYIADGTVYCRGRITVIEEWGSGISCLESVVTFLIFQNLSILALAPSPPKETSAGDNFLLSTLQCKNWYAYFMTFRSYLHQN